MSNGGGSFRGRGGGSGSQYGNRNSSGGPNRFRSNTGGGGSRFGSGGGGGRQGNTGGPAGSRLRKPTWDTRTLRPFKKNFYVPHPSVANRSPYEVEQYRRSKEITVDGHEVPQPIQHFEEASFPDYVMRGIETQGWLLIMIVL